MLRTLNSRQRLRHRINSHNFGRTSLTALEWDQIDSGPINGGRGQLTERPSTVRNLLDNPQTYLSSFGQAKIPEGLSVDVLTTRENTATGNTSLDEMSYPLGHSIEHLGTPVMDAQETGIVRHRICSRGEWNSGDWVHFFHGDPTEETLKCID